MRLPRPAVLTAVTTAALLVATPLASAQGTQWISLDAGSPDNSVSGHAELSVRSDARYGGYDLHGLLTAYSGCVTLKAKTHHWWGPDGVTQLAHVCGTNRSVEVDTRTMRNQVVLTADIGVGYDSRTVTLTG
jgi:hypothetical protein